MADEDLKIREAQAFTATIIYCPVCTTNDETEDVNSEVWQCNNCETLYAFEPTPIIVPAVVPRWESATFTGAIIFCPRCCTNIDASSWGTNHKTCQDCSTEFTVQLDPDIVAEYSRYG